jgi:pimeloyl-ACP methyl ester carboxylesterase
VSSLRGWCPWAMRPHQTFDVEGERSRLRNCKDVRRRQPPVLSAGSVTGVDFSPLPQRATLSFRIGRFKSADARGRYLTRYEELRALSPRPDVVHDVSTEFGTVRVYQHGPDGGVSVVLIHGFFLTSAMWWAQVAYLARDFTVYVVDALGQPGESTQSKAMFTPTDSARCVDAVLQGLQLHGVHLVGHSYGGWLATHTAARTPRRLASLTLVDPANTVVRLSTKFWLSVALQGRPDSTRARRGAIWITGHHALAELFGAGFAAFEPPLRTPPMRLISDHVLRSVDVPVQVLLAGNTVHDSEKGIARMRSVAPGWRYHLWPNASHALPVELPDEVNDYIRRFVTEHLSRQ